jgi:hypothetical protein
LPALIELYDEHRAHRDRFEILAFHDASAPTFADLDPKLKPIIASRWHGRPLPFPILLDSTGETIKNFGIRAFPTTILIDPEGHLVRTPDGAEEALLEKLPPIPASVRIPRALDSDVTIGVDRTPLDKLVPVLARSARVDIRLDPDGLKAAGVAADVPVPLTLSAVLTLRSWLDLILEPLGLTHQAGESGLVITARKPGSAPPEPSARQREAARRIEGVLARPFEFRFRDTPLSDVVQAFEGKTQESFVLDPAARLSGALRPESTVSGSDDGAPLGDALRRLLKPLGLTYVLRDEAVILTPDRPKP